MIKKNDIEKILALVLLAVHLVKRKKIILYCKKDDDLSSFPLLQGGARGGGAQFKILK